MSERIHFAQIINLARPLRATYREASERHGRAVAGLRYADELARAELKLSRDRCAKLAADVWTLRGLICDHLPDVAKQCPIVIAAGQWHVHGVDWAAAEAELLVIECAAQRGSAAHASNDGHADPIAVAVTMKVRNPELSLRKIARAVGVSPSTLSRSKLWKVTTQRVKASGISRDLPSGTKAKDGSIDAVSNR